MFPWGKGDSTEKVSLILQTSTVIDQLISHFEYISVLVCDEGGRGWGVGKMGEGVRGHEPPGPGEWRAARDHSPVGAVQGRPQALAAGRQDAAGTGDGVLRGMGGQCV